MVSIAAKFVTSRRNMKVIKSSQEYKQWMESRAAKDNEIFERYAKIYKE